MLISKEMTQLATSTARKLLPDFDLYFPYYESIIEIIEQIFTVDWYVRQIILFIELTHSNQRTTSTVRFILKRQLYTECSDPRRKHTVSRF